ncbi:MAG: hypothetical protein JJ958_08845 [Balneola sp.]|jgi:hypothetical protein|nr:hypothetical protein [Balneola sp.]
MKKTSKLAFIAVVLLMVACSGANELSNTKTPAANALYPSWYGAYEFSSDTTSFYARATAVASDADMAKLRAEKEARALLESYIAQELEDVRSELERDGSSIVKEPNFILMLRNAHLKVEEEASVVDTEHFEKDGVYRGFAMVEVRRLRLKAFIESGFGSKNSYIKEYLESPAFKELISL